MSNQAKQNLNDLQKLLICAVGMGLFLAWTIGNSYIKAVAGFSAGSTAHVADITAGIGANVLTLFVVAILNKQIRSLLAFNWAKVLAGACGIIGPILVVVFHLAGVLVLAIFGSALKGIAAALLFLLWNELFCRLSIKQVSICYAGAYVVSVILQIAMSALPSVLAFVCVLVCCLCSTLLLLLASNKIYSCGEGEIKEQHFFPWRLVVMVAVFTFVAFFFRQLLGSERTDLSCIGGGIVALICIAGTLFFFKDYFDASVLEYVAMPLIVAGILLYCWQGDAARGVVLIFTDAGNVAFRIFLLVVLCDICYRYGVPALWIFPIVRISMMIAEGCGLGLSIYSFSASIDLHSAVNLPICYVMIFLLVAVATPLRRSRKLSDSFYDFVSGSSKVALRKKGRKNLAKNADLDSWRVNQVARQYGLTRKEEEILSYLADGMKRVQIEEKLVLSENTVRTHMKHIYAKLGVHSYDEVVAVVKNWQ